MTLKDTNERVVNQTTGLEYEDLAARLLNRPTDSKRNVEILQLREIVVHPQAVTAWWQAHDAHEGGSTEKFIAGYEAAREVCGTSYDAHRFGRYIEHHRDLEAVADRIASTVFDALTGAGSSEPRSSPANTVPPPPDPIHAPN
jgi:hypothetical protein